MELNFDNRIIWTFFDDKVWVTESIFNTWLIMIFLAIVAIIVNRKIKKFTDVPDPFQNVVEAIVEAMENFVVSSMGKEYAYFGNWFFGVFIFALSCNYSGLVGLRPPTTDLATTAALGISTFLIIHFGSMATQKLNYFKTYLEPVPFFLPLNLIDAASKPISLSFRMFGNLLGGFIIMSMIYNMLPPFLKVGIPVPLHIYFDLFAGALQAFIFTVLSMTFIRDKLPDNSN